MDAHRLVAACERIGADAGLRGVRFRPAAFLPGFQKHQGVTCLGAEVHVVDRDALDSFLLGLVVIEAAFREGTGFGWRPQAYEFVDDVPAIDLLTGSAAFREALERGEAAWKVRDGWAAELAAFEAERRQVLRYR